MTAWLYQRAREPWTLACFAIAAAVVLLLKAHYSGASAGDLAWILGPTAWLVGTAVGSEFVFEAGSGWLSREEMFVIAPECAGVNFMLAAFVTLVVVSVPRMATARAKLAALVGSLGVAYLAALVINTARITIALRAGSWGEVFVSGPGLHRAQGIAVFFGGLLLLHLAADKLLPTEVCRES